MHLAFHHVFIEQGLLFCDFNGEIQSIYFSSPVDHCKLQISYFRQKFWELEDGVVKS